MRSVPGPVRVTRENKEETKMVLHIRAGYEGEGRSDKIKRDSKIERRSAQDKSPGAISIYNIQKANPY